MRRDGRLVFHEIFADPTNRAEIIITFLALLEMTRLRLTRLTQDGPLEPIYIELRVTEEEPALAASPADDTSEEDASEEDATEEDVAEAPGGDQEYE